LTARVRGGVQREEAARWPELSLDTAGSAETRDSTKTIGHYAFEGLTTMGTLLLSLCLLAAPPTPDEVEAAVRQLGDDDFTTREQASATLWRAGRAALSVLEAAAESEDREVATRAREVLEKVRLGVTPETPPELIGLLSSFQRGGLDQKRAVLNQLRQKQQQNMMFMLIRGESDANLRKQLAREYVGDGRRMAMELIASGDDAGAEEMLTWGAAVDTSGRSQRDYAAFLLVRGRLKEKTEGLRRPGLQSDPDTARLVCYMQVAQGELELAFGLAKAVGDKLLKADLAYRLQDWKTLAEPELLPGNEGLERLGFTASFQRLAGNPAASQQAIDGLVDLARKQPAQTYMISEGLMANGRWQEAHELFAKSNPDQGFALLSAQLRFEEAFKLAGIDDPHNAVEPFIERTKVIGSKGVPGVHNLHLGLRVVRTLDSLGERPAAEELLAKLEEFAIDDDRKAALLKTEFDLGLRDRAARRGDQMLKVPSLTSRVMYAIRPKGVLWSAMPLWEFLKARSPSKPGEEVLIELMTLLDPQRELAEGQSLADLGQELEKSMQGAPLAKRAEAMHVVAELCLLRGNAKLAREYVEKQAAAYDEFKPDERYADQPHPAAAPLRRAGDLYAQERDWTRAAEQYEKAWELFKRNPAPLYLQGRMLAEAGEEAKGRRLMDRAQLLVLADARGRQEIAAALQQLGFEQEAREQWELVLKFGPFESWEGTDAWAMREACRVVANQIGKTDKPRAAFLWERYLLYMIKTNTSFNDVAGYAEIVRLIHSAKATALLDQGKIDEALAEHQLAFAAQPGDVDAIEQILPKLIAAGRKDDADKVFDQMYEAYEKVCRSFPSAARFHNDLAWLAARNDRRLDDALQHAEEAVRLKPDMMGYVDTLAEVHFRRGNREKAIELEKQAIEREPKNKNFQEQLKRFEQ
jgi:tetratricopeptide (TPR) repeat protein